MSLCAVVMHKFKPRDGKPPSPWINTYLGASTLAIVWLILLLAGISLVAKGIL